METDSTTPIEIVVPKPGESAPGDRENRGSEDDKVRLVPIPDPVFHAAVERTLRENAELYRRLARQ
jgi:hypothetical protein